MMNSQMIDVLTELERLKDRPRFVVVVAHGLIELMVNELVRAHCRHAKEMRRVSYYRKLIVLNEMDVLPDNFFDCLNRLRKLRNRSVHEILFDPTEEDLRKVAEPLEISFPGEGSPYTDFVVLCSSIIQSLLNQYRGVLGPIMTPAGLRIPQNRLNGAPEREGMGT